MTPAVTTVPAESDVLCESCGYLLNGLPPGGRCPECGEPIAASTSQSGRTASNWENSPGPATFLQTTFLTLFRTTKFYRTLQTRADERGRQLARKFAVLHLALASLLMSATVGLHMAVTRDWTSMITVPVPTAMVVLLTGLIFTPVAFPIVLITSWGVNALAAFLTAFEANWRGYRLPLDVVRRGLNFHLAHLLPVALVLFLTVVAYTIGILSGLLDARATETYLYILAAEVVAGSGYLFWTYWIAMRNMLYANV